MAPRFGSILEARHALEEKKITARELTEYYLTRIDEKNKELNAFITVCRDEALAAADEADKRLEEGNATPLTGIPFGVKDAICTKDVRATGGATILDTYIPPYDATVIAKLRTAGAVLLGKQNCDAFGHGASNENSMYGPVKNPHDITKVAGGSSGGSAAAVAAELCLFSIAEDTGGSIRQPASFCGIVGLRPTYGRVSRYGIMPMASSLDTVGPMGQTVEDVALVLQMIAGRDPLDATTYAEAVPEYTLKLDTSVKGLKVGLPEEYFSLPALLPEVREAVEQSIAYLKESGADIIPVSLPHTKYAIPTYYLLVPSEDSSNLARLDGIRYGSRVKGESLYDVYAHTRAKGFPPEVKRRIMIGTYALSVGYYDAYYKKAQAVRTKICDDFTNVFKEVDVLITPTSPFPAFGLGEKKQDILAMYAADVFVSPAAVAGVPALSIPVGKTKKGLPIGAQLIGPKLGERVLFQVAQTLEHAL